MSLDKLEKQIVRWSANRGILSGGNTHTQCLKLASEVGELADHLIKGEDVKDDIGDCFVVLVNLARLAESSLLECVNIAYEDIKNRTGYINKYGSYIKHI